MLISHTHRFIYIHVLKTAGTSVSACFAPYSRFVDRLVYGYYPTVKFFNAFNIVFNRKGIEWLTGFTKHAKAVDVRSKVPAALFEEYFKFGFVRNPWDWMVSLYFYLQGNKRLAAHKRVSKMTFSEFIKTRCRNNSLQQIDFISDPERRMLVDFVGRFECLEEDIRYICSRLDITAPQLPQKNISYRRPQKDYRAYYDPETAGLVKQSFAEDIKIFGYSFN